MLTIISHIYMRGLKSVIIEGVIIQGVQCLYVVVAQVLSGSYHDFFGTHEGLWKSRCMNRFSVRKSSFIKVNYDHMTFFRFPLSSAQSMTLSTPRKITPRQLPPTKTWLLFLEHSYTPLSGGSRIFGGGRRARSDGTASLSRKFPGYCRVSVKMAQWPLLTHKLNENFNKCRHISPWNLNR